MTPSVSGCCRITRRRKPSGTGAAAPHLRQLRESAADIAAWADRVSADPQQHTPMARDLAGTIGPMAHASALRAEIEEAEPDDAYVARQRADFESHMRWDHPDYRYPAHLTGTSAASYPPPPEREPEAGS